MAITYGAGQILTQTFGVNSSIPLDCRFTVDKLEDLNILKAYTGLTTYVKEEGMAYIFDGTSWKVLSGGGIFHVSSSTGLINFSNNAQNGDIAYVDEEQIYYQYNAANNTWEEAQMGNNGLPVYNTDMYNKLNQKNRVSDEYLFIDDKKNILEDNVENNIYQTVNNGNIIDVLFSTIRRLQNEVYRLKNCFTYGIYSYTDTNTAKSTLLGKYYENMQDDEPLWAIDENELNTLLITSMTESHGLISKDSGTVAISDNALHITGTEIWDSAVNEWVEDSSSMYMPIVSDSKICIYIISSTLDIVVNLAAVAEDGIEIAEEYKNISINLNEYVGNTTSNRSTGFYHILLIISRLQIVNNAGTVLHKGENYVWITVNDFTTDITLVEGYINTLTEKILTSKIYIGSGSEGLRYYPDTLEFTDLVLTKLDFYSKYQNFTNEVEASKPNDSTYKYNAAHITIRSVESLAVLDSIIKQLPDNELVWVENIRQLYIIKENKKYLIGGTVTKDSSDGSTDITDTMTIQDILDNLQAAGLISLTDPIYNEDGELVTFENISINDVADITFINENTKERYKLALNSEGNLHSEAVIDSSNSILLKNIMKSLNGTNDIDLSNSDDNYLIRGYIAHALNGKDTQGNTIAISASDLKLKADRLKIGAFYAPLYSDERFGCSHSYIELENTNTDSICLNGLYLHVTKPLKVKAIQGGTESYIQVTYYLPLTGTIPGGGTYLIRGAQHAILNDSMVFINVDEFDQEFYCTDNNTVFPDGFTKANYTYDKNCLLSLLTLNDGLSDSYYAMALTYDNPMLTASTPLVKENHGGTTTWADGTKTYHYTVRPYLIDAIAYNGKSASSKWIATHVSGSTKTPVVFDAKSNCICRNTFMLDPAKQAFLGLHYKDSSRLRWQSADDYMYVDLNYEYIFFKYSPLRYPVSNFTPKASKQKKNVSTDKSKLSSETPNMVTVSFGIDMQTTRCFNWISINGTYDEFVWIRKYGESTWSNYFESYKSSGVSMDNGTSSMYKKTFSSNIISTVYNRISGIFPADNSYYTSHKVIIRISDPISSGNEPQLYEYVVGRMGINGQPDYNYISDIQTFTIYPVDYTPVVYLITDQQGFHWVEYQPWNITANEVNKRIVSQCTNSSKQYPVLINTGDMTQNGTRINEWYDYYTAGQILFDHLELMNVVGNNDLGNIDHNILGTGDDPGKSNPWFYNLFYCYEIDPDNYTHYVGTDGTDRYIPSTFYFYDNTYLFLLVNSELTVNACNKIYMSNNIDIYTGYSTVTDGTIKTDQDSSYIRDTTNTYIYETLYKILNNNKNAKYGSSKKTVIAACHEMPFTVITAGHLSNTSAEISADRSSNGASLVGSHMNRIITNSTANNGKSNGTYWFSRLLENFNISYCIGGHKHTYVCTLPVREYYYYTTFKAVTSDYSNYKLLYAKDGDYYTLVSTTPTSGTYYTPDYANAKNSNTDGPKAMSGNLSDDLVFFNINSANTGADKIAKKYTGDATSITDNLSKTPIVSSAIYTDIINNSDFSALNKNTESGSKTYMTCITSDSKTSSNYVTYFMLQASGFKVKSNKELPGPTLMFAKILPKTTPGADSDTPSNDQLSPMFAEIICKTSTPTFKLIKVINVINTVTSGKASKNAFNFLTTYNNAPVLYYFHDTSNGTWSPYGWWTLEEGTLNI